MLTPTLVNTTDKKTGVVSYEWSGVTVGDYTIRTVVSNYYSRENSIDDEVVYVYQPSGDFITGGGYIINPNTPYKSAGTLAGDPGLKTNFGFNVKYNKTGKSLQGNMNCIFRRTENDGKVHVYQIKANAMTSLGVNIANTSAQTAVFVSKANLTDITDPLNPVSKGGSLTLQVNMTDKGEPGSSEPIFTPATKAESGHVHSFGNREHGPLERDGVSAGHVTLWHRKNIGKMIQEWYSPLG